MRSLNIPDITSTSESIGMDEELKSSTLKTLRLRRWVYGLGCLILTGIVLFFFSQVLNVLAVPVGILLWSLIIVFCLRGVVNALERKGLSRVYGTLIAYVIMVVVVGAILWVMFSPMVGFSDQLANLVDRIPGYISLAQDSFNDLTAQYAYLLQDDTVRNWVNEAMTALTSYATGFAQESAKSAVSLGSGIASAVMTIGFALVVSFWVLMELPAMGREVKRLFPERMHEDLNALYLIGTRVMGGYIKGTLIQCAVIGLLCGIAFALMGIPSAAVLGVITGLLNIIPVVGPWFGGLLAALVGIFVSPVISIAALVVTIAIQQVIYTFVSPKVIGDACDVHPALIMIVLVAGSAIGGASSGLIGSLIGALISIPIVAAGKSIFVYYFEKSTGRTIVAPDGVLFKGAATKDATPMADATGEFSVPDSIEFK